MKHFTVNTALATASAVNILLNGVPQGVTTANRIGNKIKIWHVDGFLESFSTIPIRGDLYVPNNATSTSINTFSSAVNRAENWTCKSWCQTEGGSPGLHGYFWSYKFPLGLVTKYTPTTNNPNSNALQLRLTSQSATSSGGYARIWYTDA